MTAFARYLAVAGSRGPIAPPSEASWSDDALRQGVVEAALVGLAACMAADESAKSQAVDGIIGIGGHCSLEGLRVSLLGLVSTTSEVPSAFLTEAQDRSREALCLCILPSQRQSAWPLIGGEKAIGATGVLALYPADLDALAHGLVQLRELLEYKLYRRLVLDKPDPETQFDARLVAQYRETTTSTAGGRFQALEDVLAEIGDDAKHWVDHPFVPRVMRALGGGGGCLLIGPSSSGKSVLALQVGRNLRLGGSRVACINCGTASAPPADILRALAGGDDSSRVLIIDDLQSSPAVARYLLAVASLAQRASTRTPPGVLAVTWPDFASEAVAWSDNFLPLAVQAQQVRAQLIRRFRGDVADKDIDELASRFGDDLTVLRLCLERAQSIVGRLRLADVAAELWKTRTARARIPLAEARRVALIAGTLGRYDLAATASFVSQEARTPEDAVYALVASGLLRRQRSYVAMGHRSLCALLADWLDTTGAWHELASVGGARNANDVVLDYLRSLGSSLAVDTLRALHGRAGFKEGPKLSRRAAALVEIWRAFNDVVERIEHQQAVDPTWGMVPSSAMFAIQALAEIGKGSLATRSLEFLRRHWRLAENGGLELDRTGFTTNVDFEKIREAMLKEDRALGAAVPRYWARTEEVDIARFHHTWLSGIVLCAEASAAEHRRGLTRLVEAVEATQLPGGAFYPERVPWSTARVMLGLAACGRTVDTSPAVGRAVQWLLRDERDGGPCWQGIWLSGTGDWNSTLETTGMVLLALASVGFNCSDERVAPAKSYLLSQRSLWTATGKELDGAQALQAFLETGGEWDAVAHEAQRLSQWARGEAFWRTATLSPKESLEQSCRVAQIACHLVSIGWSALRSDLPAFLDALALSQALRTEMLSHIEVPPSPPPGNGSTGAVADRPLMWRESPAIGCLAELKRISLKECTVVGQYRRFEERTRNRLRDWNARIIAALETKMTGRENYLIWAAPGSGKSFFVQETARAIKPSVAFIELNLARQTRDAFVQGVAQACAPRQATLCLVDEIDARGGESWPYGDLLGLLDISTTAAVPVVVVLVGSSGAGLQAMTRGMAAREKGSDLLDRVPADRRFEIPELTLEDRVVIVASHVLDAARGRSVQLEEIEKLALYYTLVSPELRTARQLREAAVSAVQRVAPSERRLKYEHLFVAGDRRNQLFWVEHQEAAVALSDVFVILTD